MLTSATTGITELRDTRKEINRVRCRMIRRVHARSQFVRSYTNVHVNRMTGSVRTGPPATGVKVGATGNKRGKKEDSLSLFFVVGAIVAVLRGGSPRLNTASPWEASRRPLSLYNFNSRLDDFVRLTPFFSPFPRVALSGTIARKQLVRGHLVVPARSERKYAAVFSQGEPTRNH